VFRQLLPADPFGATRLIGDENPLEAPAAPPVASEATAGRAEPTGGSGGADLAPHEREAYEALELKPPASAEQVQHRFRELYSELQVRLDNAPTPELKSRYRDRLDRLKIALATLVPAIDAEPDTLPSAEPVDVTGMIPPALAAPRLAASGAAGQASAEPAAAAVPAAAGGEAPPRAPRRERRGRLPRSAIFMSVLAMVTVSVAAAFLVLYLGQARVRGAMQSDLASARKEVAALEQQIPEVERTIQDLQSNRLKLLENRALKICNMSQSRLIVRWLDAAYVRPDGQFGNFDSLRELRAWDLWVIPPGGTQQFNYVRGDQVVWDGSAVFFSALLSYRGDERFTAVPLQALGGECYRVAFD
jgi:cell division protein FtsB